jgi:hypothetical protein
MPGEYKNYTVADTSGGKKAKQRAVSEKIAHLIRSEGKTPKQAAGQAYGMMRSKKG